MYNVAAGLPDLYMSEGCERMGINVTVRDHPIEAKSMYYLHECQFVKVME
jgi:hypothetical protein